MDQKFDMKTKAGNPGDVAKHCALLSLLSAIYHYKRVSGQPLWYIDGFSGPPENRLSEQSKFGVKKLVENLLTTSVQSTDGNLYSSLCVGPATVDDSKYPGSTAIVKRLAHKFEVPTRMDLYDTDLDTVFELREFFPKAVVTHAELNVRKIQRLSSEEDISNRFPYGPDLIFLDPPGISGQYPNLLHYNQFLKEFPTMVWLPYTLSGVDVGGFIERSDCVHLAIGVYWGRITGGSTVGCYLLFSNLKQEFLKRVQSTLEDICENVMGFQLYATGPLRDIC